MKGYIRFMGAMATIGGAVAFVAAAGQLPKTLAPPTAPPAVQAVTPPKEKTLELIRALQARHASVKTVSGTFSQLKKDSIFLDETKSTGRIWFSKPDLFRCDYDPPDEMTMLISEDLKFYLYVKEIEQVDIYAFRSEEERDQQLHSMVLAFGFEADRLVKEYEVRSSEDDPDLAEEVRKAEGPEQVLIHLTPGPIRLDSSPFAKLKLWIDKKTLVPVKIWFQDSKGDVTTLDQLNLALDQEIDPKLFEPRWPRGTEVIDRTRQARIPPR